MTKKSVLVVILVGVVCFAKALPAVDRSWRVVGGSNAAPGEAPYQVILRIDGMFNCAGIIVSRRTVLTAANCIMGFQTSRLSVVAGTNFLSSGGQTYNVERVIVHENYGTPTIYSNDIGLLILQRDMEFTSLIQAIELNNADIQNPINVKLTGWGRTGVTNPPSEALQKINLRTIGNAECGEFMGDLLTNTMICTLTKEGEGVCNGDSGGPLTSEDGKLVGVVSWGNPCALGVPDVYSRISSFVQWVNGNGVF